MYLRQQTPNAIADLRNLPGQILVKATEHGELCDLTVGQRQRAKRGRQAARGLSDNVCVPSVSLELACVQVRNASHRKSRQISHQHAFSTRHRYWKCTDRRRLIHDQQNRSMFFEQLAEQRSQLRLIIGQSTVQKPFALAIKGYGMMRSLANVDTDEDFDAVMLLN